MALTPSSTTRSAAAGATTVVEAQLRQTCLDAAAALGFDNEDAVRTRILSYLGFVVETQLSSAAEGEDPQNAERLCSASAIFLALYDEPAAPVAEGETTGLPSDAANSSCSCRLGDLMRQCKTGVKDFMELLTLLAGRLPRPLSERLEGDLRVMKEGIVVTKMLHGKYRQMWNERRSLLPAEMLVRTSTLTGNGAASAIAAAGAGAGAACKEDSASARDAESDDHGSTDPGHSKSVAPTKASFQSPLPPPPPDPQALPRLGWYLYLLTKDVLGFRSSNVMFVRCLNLVLAALGAVVWNSSCFHQGSSTTCPPLGSTENKGDGDGSRIKRGVGSPEEGTAPASSDSTLVEAAAWAGGGGGAHSESATASGVEGGSSGGGTYGGEAALLVRLSASGRCPPKEVRAMSTRVVEVIEALLVEGILLSHHRSSASASSPPTAAAAVAAGGAGGAGVSLGSSQVKLQEGLLAGAENAVAPTVSGSSGDERKAPAVPLPPPRPQHQQLLAGRAERVAGVFHPSVAGQNADRLDACYWERVSQRGGGRGGVVLDETFVLTPDLRDTIGTPRFGGSTPRRSALTPSVSHASRQLFQDYQRVSNAAAASAAAATTTTGGAQAASQAEGMGEEDSQRLALSFAPPGGGSSGSASAEDSSAGAGSGYRDSLLPGPAQVVGGGQVENGHGEAAGSGGGGGGGGEFGVLRSPGASGRGMDAAGMPGVLDGGAGEGQSRGGPPETPVMAVMETVRWIGGLDAGEGGPPDSLMVKLKKCTTFSTNLLQERLIALMAKLDGPASQDEGGGLSSFGRGGGRGGSRKVGGMSVDADALEASVVADAKKKAETLYYTTLELLLDAETDRLRSEDHSRLLEHESLHKALLACCLEAVLKASSLLSLTFPWVLRRMEVDALDLCKVLESFARFCPGLPMNLKYHLFEVQTEIVERLALETGAGVFKLIAEHKAAGEWPVLPLRETDVAPPTGSHLANLPCSPQEEKEQQPMTGTSVSVDGASGTAVSAGAATGSSAEKTAEVTNAATEGEGDDGMAAAAAAAARARASTLDLFFKRLMKRAAEVVAELCLRRLHLPGDTADQVWTVVKRCVAQRTEMLRDRHLHHVVLCSTYSVCKVNSVTPEVTFKRIIEQYKQLAGAGLSGGVGTPRLTIVKDILLQRGETEQIEGGNGAGGERRRQEERGDIIKFYNKVYIPAMKQFVLEFKNLAGQQQGVASVATAQDAARVAKRVQPRRAASTVATTPPLATATSEVPSSSLGGDGGQKGDEEKGDPAAPQQRRSQRQRLTRSSASASGVSSSTAHQGGDEEREKERGGREPGGGDKSGGTRGDGTDSKGHEGSRAPAKEARGEVRTGSSSSKDDLVAAGAGLSALNTAPHPHKPLVSQLPSQKVADPKRVQDNVYLTTVSSPSRPSRSPGPAAGAGAARGASVGGSDGAPGDGGEKAGGGGGSSGGGSGAVAMEVQGGTGVAGGAGTYAFGESASRQDLQLINRTVRRAAAASSSSSADSNDDSSSLPPSAKRARSSWSSESRRSPPR